MSTWQFWLSIALLAWFLLSISMALTEMLRVVRFTNELLVDVRAELQRANARFEPD